MPFIPRQVKPPARIALTCKVPEAVGTLLKHYAEFLESSQEYVVAETLRLAFRRDKEFQAWLATAHPETPLPTRESTTEPEHQLGRTRAVGRAAVIAPPSPTSEQLADRSEVERPARRERVRS
jgi:hypothetical protein